MKPIYCAISVEQELPKEATDVFAFNENDKWESQCALLRGKWYNSWDYDGIECYPTHWLKPITSLSDLPEEWKAEIREIAGKAFDAGMDYECNASNIDKQEHLKGIL